MTPEWGKLREWIGNTVHLRDGDETDSTRYIRRIDIFAKMDEIEAEAGKKERCTICGESTLLEKSEWTVTTFFMCDRCDEIKKKMRPLSVERVREIAREEIGKARTFEHELCFGCGPRRENPTYSAQTINEPEKDK